MTSSTPPQTPGAGVPGPLRLGDQPPDPPVLGDRASAPTPPPPDRTAAPAPPRPSAWPCSAAPPAPAAAPPRRGPKFGLDRSTTSMRFSASLKTRLADADPRRCRTASRPDGSLHAVPERGALMGNRGGRLHRPDGTLGRARWRSRAWICCLTDFRGRHRPVMGDGYTELFFLDEATALAAGHRPCFECRRADARAFAAAWARAARRRPAPRAAAMDRSAARRAPRPARPPSPSPTCRAGAIFARRRRASTCRRRRPPLRLELRRLRPAARLRRRSQVAAITPGRHRAALAAGYRPELHPSAGRSVAARGRAPGPSCRRSRRRPDRCRSGRAPDRRRPGTPAAPRRRRGSGRSCRRRPPARPTERA